MLTIKFFANDGASAFSLLPIIPHLSQKARVLMGMNINAEAYFPQADVQKISQNPLESIDTRADAIIFTDPYFFDKNPGIYERLQADGTTTFFFPYCCEFMGPGYPAFLMSLSYIQLSDYFFATSPFGVDVYHTFHKEVLKKVFCLGNPEMDILYDKTYEQYDSYKALMSFRAGRPCFLWTPHWSIITGPYSSNWLTVGPILKEYFETHPEHCCIIRNHPHLLEDIKRADRVLRLAVYALYDEFSRMPNVFMDQFDTSISSIGASDFLITDRSSMIQKYYATNKPIIVCSDDLGKFHEYVNRGAYIVDKAETVIDRIYSILTTNAQDKVEFRHRHAQDYSGPYDGKCAKRIALFLLHILNSKK